MKRIIYTLLCFFLCHAVLADDAEQPVESLLRIPGFGLYVGAGFGRIASDAKDNFDRDVNYTGAEILGGIYWRWLGVEARSGKSLQDETIQISEDPDTGVPVTAKKNLESYLSYYLRVQRTWDIARIYGLVGVTDMTTVSTFDDGVVEKLSLSGTSYGAGVGFNINPNMAFNFEVKSLLSDDDNAFLMTSFNIDLRF